MARSEEAILRRALKRDRTEGQQRHADRTDMERQAAKLTQNVRTESDSNKRPRPNPPNSDRKENRISSSVGRRPQSFRQDRGNTDPYNRHASNKRGGRNPRSPPRVNKKQGSRHNKETSKKLVWARQADSKKISKNQELRQRYEKTGGEGMDAKDLERAKLLVARDERKQERKKKSNEKVPITSTGTSKEGNSVSIPKNKVIAQEEAAQQAGTHESKSKKGKKTSEAQAKRDQNKALRLLYLKTDGKGMKEDQIERAKLLIARDEKKQKRRAQKEAGEKQ